MKQAKPNAQFKIEHGIEIPAATRPRASKYPFATMKPGDSFFVPGFKSNQFSSHSEWGRRHGGTFCIRTVDGGVRIWCVKQARNES